MTNITSATYEEENIMIIVVCDEGTLFVPDTMENYDRLELQDWVDADEANTITPYSA